MWIFVREWLNEEERGGRGKTKMRESVVVEQLRAGSRTRFREWNRV